MLREIPHAVALALVLGAVPAFAQPVPAAAPEDATVARTLEQNRRVLVGQPAQSGVLGGPATEPAASAARNDRAGPAPASGTGFVGLAAGGKPGTRRGG
jgi:hypothetical protein